MAFTREFIGHHLVPEGRIEAYQIVDRTTNKHRGVRFVVPSGLTGYDIEYEYTPPSRSAITARPNGTGDVAWSGGDEDLAVPQTNRSGGDVRVLPGRHHFKVTRPARAAARSR